MKNYANNVKSFMNKNKMPVLSAFAAVAVVGLPVYAHQSGKPKPQVEEAPKVAQVSEKPKQQPKKVKAATTTKTETTAPKTTTTQTKTTYTTTKPKTQYTEKKKAEPTYIEVNVSLSVSGDSVTASIASAKPGKCYFAVKNYTTEAYEDATVSASDGSCSWTIPAGDWEKVKVQYKSSDGTKKGYAYKEL